jgi:hypothetical protein
MGRYGVVCAAVLLAACSRREPVARTQPPKARPAPSAPAPVAAGIHDCGSERSAHGQGVNVPARECFWQAFREGRPARLSITIHTIEGDPLRYDLTSKGKTSIDVVHESHDRFGARGTTRFVCRSLERRAGEVSFTLRGCDGGSETVGIQ